MMMHVYTLFYIVIYIQMYLTVPFSRALLGGSLLLKHLVCSCLLPRATMSPRMPRSDRSDGFRKHQETRSMKKSRADFL